MDQVCRICMSGAGDLLDIFVSHAESPSLEEMINECVDVKINRDDQYPKQICGICIGDVHCAYRFKKNYTLTLEQLSKPSPINISEEPKNTVMEKGKQDEDSKTTITKGIQKQKLLRAPKKFSNIKIKKIKIALKLNGKNKPKLESNLKKANLKKKSELKLNEKEVMHVCLICGKVFPKKVGLSTHMHKKHIEHIDRNRRTVKCPHCHKDFAFNHTLKKHLMRQVCTKEVMGPIEKENIESSRFSYRTRKHIA